MTRQEARVSAFPSPSFILFYRRDLLLGCCIVPDISPLNNTIRPVQTVKCLVYLFRRGSATRYERIIEVGNTLLV